MRNRQRVVSETRPAKMTLFVIAFTLLVVIPGGKCACPDFSLSQTTFVVAAGQQCNLTSPPNLNASTLVVEGEVVIGFEDELVVDVLIVKNTGHISADGEGHRPGNGTGPGTSAGSGGKLSHGLSFYDENDNTKDSTVFSPYNIF